MSAARELRLAARDLLNARLAMAAGKHRPADEARAWDRLALALDAAEDDSRADAPNVDLTPAQVVSMEFEAYLHSDSLDPAWVAGWHSAINHATAALIRAATSEVSA